MQITGGMKNLRWIRAYNTALASIGGLVLSLDLIFAFWMGQSWLDSSSLVTILAIFWLVNFGLIVFVASGKTEQYKDPSLTVLMMWWASFCCFAVLVFIKEYQEIIYCSLFTVVVFGVFRLTPKDFKRYTLFIVSLQALQSIVAFWLGEAVYGLLESLIIWLVLSSTILIMIGLSNSMSELRQRLWRKNQDLEEALRAKDQFLANMSHELRTPINGVLGMLEVLNSMELTAGQRKYIEIAQASGTSLVCLVNDILDFAKIKENKLNLESRTIRLVDALSKLAFSFYYQANQKNIELILDIDPKFPKYVQGDEIRITQIFNNLISNAIKFTREGSVVVSISGEQIGEQFNFYGAVTDTGIGIPPGSVDTVFLQFSQADESTTRQYGGTGLGLAIVKQLCSLMGGDIQLESTVGLGSRFSFQLKLGSVEQISNVNDKPIEGYTVHLIDSNSAHQKFMVKQFERLGASVVLHQDLLGFYNTGVFSLPDSNKLLMAIHLDAGVSRSEFGGFLEQRVVLGLPTLVFYYGKIPVISSDHPVVYLEKPVSIFELDGVVREIANSTKTVKEIADLRIASHNPAQLRLLPCNVLVVEDNPVNQEVARAMLKKLGATPTVANNGEEAIKLLNQRSLFFDLVLMDCQIPVLDGFETTVAIREGRVGDRYKQIPIIALTANALSADREKCMKVGMNDYLAKPISFSALAQILPQWIKPSLKKTPTI